MNEEFFNALKALETEKGIPVSYMLEKVSQALITAYRRDFPVPLENIIVEPDQEAKTIRMFIRKEAVNTIEEPLEQIDLEQAKEIVKQIQPGEFVNVEVDMASLGRIAAQTAKQVIIQGIREAERGMVLNEFSSREHEVLTAIVNRIDLRNSNVVLDMVSEGEKTEAVLGPSEQVPGEKLEAGMHVKVYVVEVRRGTRGPQVLISRTHPGLVKRLFELEVPEIHDGTVVVHSIAREAGNRTKIAVGSQDENVDAIGACVGNGGARVNAVGNELSGEKIDIIRYSEDLAKFAAAALSPADVVSSEIIPGSKSCRVVVPDDQLSLAIGKEGQNVRLAAKLTGCKIDIKSVSQAQQIQMAADLELSDTEENVPEEA